MTPDNFDDLLEILTQQSNVVGKMIELGLAETDAFKIDDVPRIMAIVERQKEAVAKMSVLEQRKAELTNRGTTLQGMPPFNSREIQPVYEDAISCLTDLVRRLQKINETNRLLARMSLSYTRMMQKALGIAANGSYDHKGMPAAPQGYLGRLNASA
jgi:flagellar biosynthesis/type III secretory pathway chaperone